MGIEAGEKMTSISEIFSVISDEDSLNLIQMIVERRDPKISDFESPKRYYTRLAKLKNAHMIKKQGKSYDITAFGSIIYDMIRTIKLAHDLHWKLRVIDAMNDKVPRTERNKIIESLIQDESIRGILTEYPRVR
jgi:hypothetical protein